MDKFQVGDKVNFMTDKGGGVVKKIIDTKMVLVEIEDGFEIPCLISDLILDFRTQPHKQQISDTLQKEIQREEAEKAEASDEARRGTLRRFARNAEEEGVYLSFVPHDQQWLLTGLIDVVLLNHTEAELLYSFNIKETDNYKNIDYGQMQAHSKVVIETIARDDIEYWCEGFVQGLVIKEDSNMIFRPLHAPFALRSTRFFKEGSYTASAVLGEKAVTVTLSTYNALKCSDTDCAKLADEGLGSKVAEKPIVKQAAAIDKHKTTPGEAIVDLHIGELVDNILGMSSNDMFRIQMDYFKRMLASAIENEYSKVTFIHGVGNGVLKNAIIDELKNYENTSNRMASICKFGVGAIDVMIKDK